MFRHNIDLKCKSSPTKLIPSSHSAEVPHLCNLDDLFLKTRRVLKLFETLCVSVWHRPTWNWTVKSNYEAEKWPILSMIHYKLNCNNMEVTIEDWMCLEHCVVCPHNNPTEQHVVIYNHVWQTRFALMSFLSFKQKGQTLYFQWYNDLCRWNGSQYPKGNGHPSAEGFGSLTLTLQDDLRHMWKQTFPAETGRPDLHTWIWLGRRAFLVFVAVLLLKPRSALLGPNLLEFRFHYRKLMVQPPGLSIRNIFTNKNQFQWHSCQKHADSEESHTRIQQTPKHKLRWSSLDFDLQVKTGKNVLSTETLDHRQ